MAKVKNRKLPCVTARVHRTTGGLAVLPVPTGGWGLFRILERSGEADTLLLLRGGYATEKEAELAARGEILAALAEEREAEKR